MLYWIITNLIVLRRCKRTQFSKYEISLPKCKFQLLYINKIICRSNVWCPYFAYEINLACKICWPWIMIMFFSTLYEWQNISVTRIIYVDVSVYRSLNCTSRICTCLFFVRSVCNSFKAHQYFQLLFYCSYNGD